MASNRYGRLMRLDKPVGNHLLFLPAAWSISFGAASPTDWLYFTPLFYTGSILLRGAGCTINDIWDSDIDRKVERTRNRPIAAGEITTTSAFCFLGAQLAGGLVVLSQLNTASFLTASLSVLALIFYPFAKRHTRYPQAVLGLTINWGAFLGATATTGTITLPSILLYGAGWCWTMIYDTIYAHQDKKDDKQIGISSTALTFKERPKLSLAMFTVGKMGLLTTAGIMGDMSLPYFACVAASGAHVTRQITNIDLDNPEQCQKAFESNTTTGAITWLGATLGRIV